MHKNKSSTSLPTISSSTRQGASNKHAQMLKQFNEDIFKRNVLTDVEVFVKGKVFRSHRSLLICFSPYLRQKLISSEGRPITNKVEIPLIDSNEFDVLLRYMYTGNLHIDCNIFLRVYQAASLLEMQDVMQECLQLLESENDMQTYFYVYMISKQMGIHSNWLRAFRLITHRFEECVFATEFMLLKVEYAIEILSAQTIGARSEVIVFLAGLNWLNYDYTSRCTYAVKIMECVRFSSMTMEEIVACYHPPFLPQVVEIPEIVELLFRANCYITAKALGQESWFKQYSNPKRMLAFENLSMELWHQKSPSSTPNLSVYCEEMNNMEDSLYLNTDINRTSDSITVSQADGNRDQMHPSTGKVERCKSTEKERRLREKRGNCAKLEKHAEGNKSGKEELNHSGTDSECEVKVISTHRRKESPLHSSITEKQNFSFISQQFSSNNQKHNSECTSNNIQSSSDHTREQQISVQGKSPETIEKKSNFRRCHEISRELDSDSDQYVKTQQTRNTANPEDETIPGSGSAACDTLDTSIKEELVRCAVSPSIKHAHARMSQKTEPVKITNRNRGAKSQSTTKFKTAYEDGNEILPETSGGTEKSCRKKEKRNSDNGDNRSKSSIASDTVSSRSYMEENMFIFVIGGMNQNNPKSGKGGVVLHLDVKKNKWKQTSSLPQPRHNHGAVYYDNCIYVVGGCDPYDTVEQCRYIARRSCFKFDLRTQTWSNLADMHFPRYDHSLIALDGLMYAIGGQSDGERLHKTMEIYDFKRDRWQLHTSEMCCGKKAMGIAALNCRIWVGGGLIQPDNEIDLQATAQIDCYDPKENRWLFNLYSLPSPRCYCNLIVWRGKLYCIGGTILLKHENVSPTDEVWVFNNETKIWEEGTSLPEPRMGVIAVSCGDRLYILGGFDSKENIAIRKVNFLATSAISWEAAASVPSHLLGFATVSYQKGTMH